jgi:hypothetical protein
LKLACWSYLFWAIVSPLLIDPVAINLTVALSPKYGLPFYIRRRAPISGTHRVPS